MSTLNGQATHVAFTMDHDTYLIQPLGEAFSADATPAMDSADHDHIVLDNMGVIDNDSAEGTGLLISSGTTDCVVANYVGAQIIGGNAVFIDTTVDFSNAGTVTGTGTLEGDAAIHLGSSGYSTITNSQSGTIDGAWAGFVTIPMAASTSRIRA